MLKILLASMLVGVMPAPILQSEAAEVLSVPKIFSPAALAAEEIPALMDASGLPFQKIGCVNWPDEYPYCPDVSFRMAHTGDAILIHYRVSEDEVRALASEDNGQVWKDSCVEFFVSPDCNDVYYNFEMNCIGRVLEHFGPQGDNRRVAGREILSKLDRWSSLGSEPFANEPGPHSWEAALLIPVDALFGHSISSLDGLDMTANFYKCGDGLAVPHFLSWLPVSSRRPQFHLPAFFGPVHFEKHILRQASEWQE